VTGASAAPHPSMHRASVAEMTHRMRRMLGADPGFVTLGRS
jgi:hypothetical protein